MSGPRPSAADEDGLITCLECGRRFRGLISHVTRIHHLSAGEYRALHDLPASAVLIGDGARERQRAAAERRIADDPEMITRLRAALPPLSEIAARSAERRAETDDLPRVREARRRGVDGYHARQAVERDERARTLGYGSWAHLIESTRHERAAWRRLGIARDTLDHWRRKLR